MPQRIPTDWVLCCTCLPSPPVSCQFTARPLSNNRSVGAKQTRIKRMLYARPWRLLTRCCLRIAPPRQAFILRVWLVEVYGQGRTLPSGKAASQANECRCDAMQPIHQSTLAGILESSAKNTLTRGRRVSRPNSRGVDQPRLSSSDVCWAESFCGQHNGSALPSRGVQGGLMAPPWQPTASNLSRLMRCFSGPYPKWTDDKSINLSNS